MGFITKSPKWIQTLIEKLKRERDAYRAKWESIFAEEPTGIEVRDVYNKPAMFLSPYAYIYFRMNRKQGVEGRIRIYFDSDRRLVVHGDGAFNILPRASNSFYIEMAE